MSEGGQLGYSLVQTVSSREDLAFKNSSLNEMPLTILIFSESTAIYPKGNTASVTAVICLFSFDMFHGFRRAHPKKNFTLGVNLKFTMSSLPPRKQQKSGGTFSRKKSLCTCRNM